MTFKYTAPRTFSEAVKALGDSPRARILAGGTDVILQQRHGGPQPTALVDIKRIRRAGELRLDGGGSLIIGPAVTMSQLEQSSEAARLFPALVQGAAVVGSAQIRNRATVIGNICNAAPCADTAPGLIVLGARARILGPQGRRSLPVERLMVGPGRTALARGEMVTAIRVPAPGPRTGSAYARHTPRQNMDIAVAAVGAALELAEDGITCRRARICLGAVAPTPLRAIGAEELLQGQELTVERLAAAALAAASACRPISDVRASAGFRRDLARVLTRRMLEAALADARERAGKGRRRA